MTNKASKRKEEKEETVADHVEILLKEHNPPKNLCTLHSLPSFNRSGTVRRLGLGPSFKGELPQYLEEFYPLIEKKLPFQADDGPKWTFYH